MPEFDIELPACFYLGLEYDLHNKAIVPEQTPVMYDARDLLTHGVVVGMTGSGKTGLCINILEEAAIDGINCIILDIKGDLSNLLLQFPELKPDDFLKWLNPEDARRQELTIEEYAEKLSTKWKEGLIASKQSPDRIQRLKDSGEWLIYTPGSDAGLPLSILRTFSAPLGKISREALNQKIDATASALLGLTGIVSDPVQSREHILIAQILLHAWSKNQDLDLAQLISRVQNPPMRTIGAFDVETFYPEKDRLRLAVSLNNILASPSFSTWIEGDPLDLGQLLPGGKKPRHLIFYLAHLDDAQRMFFLTLLLDEVLNWTRKQSGTTSLRALLYFDEVFGYLPPHPGNPPTKQPLMTLLKQARAFGVGVLLATQNPVDLDYKALSNAGTWMVGKLQTERDKARLMQGLESVAAEKGTLADRKYLENVIASLGNRVFLLHDVHRSKPILFQTRWALSFLRGPMTREQIEELMQEEKEQRGDLMRSVEASTTSSPSMGADVVFKENLKRTSTEPNESSHVPPVLSTGVNIYYLPVLRESTVSPTSTETLKSPLPVAQRLPDDYPIIEPPVSKTIHYRAQIVGFGEVTFVEKKRQVERKRKYHLLVEAPDGMETINWANAESIHSEMADRGEEEATWGTVPESCNTARKLTSLRKEFSDHLYRSAKLTLFENKKLSLLSEEGEDLQSFLNRCREAAPQEAEKQIAEEKKPFQNRFEELTSQIPSEPPTLPFEPKAKSFWDLPILSWFKPTAPSPQPIPVDPKVAKAKEALSKEQGKWQQRKSEIYAEWTQIANQFEEVMLKPRKVDVEILTFGLAWVPYRQLTFADGRSEFQPAYRRLEP